MNNIEPEEIKKFLARLGRMSAYYPTIRRFYFKGYTYLSTLVRIKRDEKYYVILTIQSIKEIKRDDLYNCLLQLVRSVHEIRYLYKINEEYDKPDRLQISEKERLIKLDKQIKSN